MKTFSAPTQRIADESLAAIFSIVEARQGTVSILAVASASELDDTEPVARGIAQAARDAGKRTGYLYLGEKRRVPHDGDCDYRDITVATRTSPRESLDLWLGVWRPRYDIIVVEIPQLTNCVLGAHMARLADAIIVAVFPERRVTKADRQMTALFGLLQTAVVGVVKTARYAEPKAAAAPSGVPLSSFFLPSKSK